MKTKAMFAGTLIVGIGLTIFSQTMPNRRNVTIKMKNGDVRHGTFLKADNSTVDIEAVSSGKVTLATGDVVSISFVADVKTAEVPPPETSDAKRALRALETLAAATEVGINYREYGKRLIDVKVAVEDILHGLPAGELKTEIAAALKEFQDAKQVWDIYVADRSPLMLEKLYDGWKAAKGHLARAELLMIPKS